MKILLFNLGTVGHRILSWEVDGFKAIFEQDIVLWGPIPDKQFIYNGREIPILRVFEQSSIFRVFEQLPKGWLPDIVTCDTSVLNYIPDIYKCPTKTVLYTRDSWSDTIFNRGLVEFFDFVNSSAVDRSLFRDYNVNLLPLTGFAVSSPSPGTVNSEFNKRDIDVIAIANYDNSFYHERHKTFYNLSYSNKGRHKINFVRHIKRSEIYNYYQRSKIVLDWAHTLSNRSYEAALNGCLLFSHEDNTVMSEFWVPWEEYIPYNDNNLSELISHYLNNPELAETITEKARQKISSVPSTWGEMTWEKIRTAYETDISIQERINHNESLSQAIIQYRCATPFLYNYDYKMNFPDNWKELYFQRLNNAFASAVIRNERILPLIEASRGAFLFGPAETALVALDQLEKILPDYAWIYYMRARIYFSAGEHDKSLVSLMQAINKGTKEPDLLQRYILPVIEKGNPCDGRRITNYMWQSVYGHNNEFQVKSLMHLSLELMGVIYELKNEKQKAIDSFAKAIEYIPIPGCIYKLSPILIECKNYKKLSGATQKGLEESPYDTVLTLYRAYAMIWLGQRREACSVLRSHRAGLKSFVGVRQINRTRIAVSVMIPLVYISRRSCSLLIIKITKRLREVSGFTYLG